MKTRIALGILIAVVMSLSLAVAQSKEECSSKAVSVKSCSKDGASSAQASKTGEAVKANIVLASDKKSVAKTDSHCEGKDAKACATKAIKASGECTEEEMAKCDMKKASLVKASTQMECCKDGKKAVKAEKKTTIEKIEAKGTN